MTETIEAKTIQAEAETIIRRAGTLSIVDQASYDLTIAVLKEVKDFRRKLEAFFRPNIDRWHAGWKAALAELKAADEPLASTETRAKQAVWAWEMEQERLRRERQRLIEEEARRQAEEEILAAAVAAEAEGASVAEVDAVMAEALAPILVVPPAPPAYQKAEGIAVRKSYGAEVVNLAELIRHVAAHPELSNLLTPNMTALRALVRAQGAQFRMPGVRLVEVANVAVRS